MEFVSRRNGRRRGCEEDGGESDEYGRKASHYVVKMISYEKGRGAN